jgi:hypothetical protein
MSRKGEKEDVTQSRKDAKKTKKIEKEGPIGWHLRARILI